jgi:peptide/nickel transport system permease protein
MLAYIIRRAIIAVVIVFIVSVLVFLMVRVLPGDPVMTVLSGGTGGTLTQEQVELARHEYGLDKPLPLQYLDWTGGFFQGKLGQSLGYSEPVTALLARRIPVTLHLGLLAFVFGNFLGVLAGIISATRRGKFLDMIVTVGANIGVTIPIFWLGIMLIWLFGLKLGWLPIQGYTSPSVDFWLNARQLVLPIICLSVFSIGAIARQTRSSMLEVLHQDYIRTAWSKGLKERTIVVKHVLKNSLIPIVTLAGMQLTQILGGSVIIETVFNIPGMGRLAVSGVLTLDYPVVQSIILLIAVMVVVVNLIVDISYGWLDPRVRYN